MIKIYNAQNVLEAEKIVSILESGGVNAFYKDASSNLTMYHMQGFGLYGVDVFVEEKDRDRAAKLLCRILKSSDRIK